MSPSRQTSVPAIERAAAILDVLAASEGVAVSASDLARRLDRPKSSTASLCAALETVGLIERREAGYQLGRKLAELGGRYLSTLDEVSEFYQSCKRSPILSRETARAAILDGTEVLYLARYDGVQPLRLTSHIGDRFPASCTATGKALLAHLDPAVLADRYRRFSTLPALTPRSLTNVPDLMAELETIRWRGWAIDDEETTIGVTCLAVAVGPPQQPARFAVSVTFLTSRLGQDLRLDDLVRELHALAETMASPLTPR